MLRGCFTVCFHLAAMNRDVTLSGNRKIIFINDETIFWILLIWKEVNFLLRSVETIEEEVLSFFIAFCQSRCGKKQKDLAVDLRCQF